MFLLTGVAPLSANTSPAIKIDGQTRMFDPPCQIVDGRTMIPVRYVIEDPALQGTVTWDADTSEVGIECKDKHFVFKIASHTVSVDGEYMDLDVAPYIYQNRTYIPLRFLAERLSAQVTWNASAREVSIDFNPKNSEEVFAYYYYHSFDELKENADSITDVALRWFETNENGDLFYEYQDDYDEILQFARDHNIKTHASVVYMDKEGMHELLSDPARRQYLIEQLSKQVKENNYDGVNIDFEFLGQSDRDNFTLFLKELKQSLGNDKQLSVALFACTKAQSWLAGYDYDAIGGIVDRVVIMAYDYNYKTSPAGPVAPLWWVEDVVAYLKSIIPAEKMLLGLPTYGYDWGDGITTTTVTAKRLQSLKNQYHLTESFDEASMSPYYSYVDNNGVSHQIWLENRKSLNAKLDVALDNHLAGVSFWRIGNGFTDLYDLLAERITGN
jgi:spore germination protein YaaH